MATPILVANPGFPGAYGSAFGPANTTTLTANQNVILPAGYYFVRTGTQDSVQFVIAAGNTLTPVPANSFEYGVLSDGQNVSIRNSGTVGTASVYIRQNGAI